MANEALLRLERVSKRFDGGVVGMDDISLDIAEGEFLSLLGPSGCGKTTTLRVIAGFDTPTAGRLRIDGRDITALRPFARPVNTVFQDYALFPHMNVAENVGFGLSLRPIAGTERARRVAEALAMVGLSDKAGQRVQALSGGQRQRVALARALVCQPRLLLLDEPLSALDANLREQMQLELKRLQRELGTTFVMVTHDQTEALSISDRIVVMNRGRIEQVASPATLYDGPATRFVASFIGAMNLLPARIGATGDAGATVAAGGMTFQVPLAGRAGVMPLSDMLVGIRPEDVVLAPGEGPSGAASGIVEGTSFQGRSLRVHLRLACGPALMADVARGAFPASVGPGDRLSVSVRAGAACALLPADG
ncbi:spermidine/putrescine transport system ATP-binding protein [Angulomicrobium tetraedrale]|uniref:Spermidine/putrescine transport system ATP-binding protein n=1 Tax=Ancylobacter tetraedralis TaxID=217068 RepID=A0A839ZD60_9HYPH|nr:ABC transporter ATP-binding protein [Ancylobacter tetraedralis]MBB3772679.1 spermidine/putrescine transport system ATP-binding protein [Ancylobacter tetraedralis]